MKRRFIVAIDSSTREQDKAFRDYIKANSFGWWHWISNVWLLSTNSSTLNIRQLRDELEEIYPRVRKLIFELSDGNDGWAGSGPKAANGKSMFEWLRKNWKRK